MGGSLELANAPEGGFIAHIRLKRVQSGRNNAHKNDRGDRGDRGGRSGDRGDRNGGVPSTLIGDSNFAWADTRAGAPSGKG